MIRCKIGGVLWHVIAAGLSLIALGCGDVSPVARTGVVVGLANTYNYSASVIRTGDQEQFWWCAGAPNPTNSFRYGDTIQYQSINVTTHQTQTPVTALVETQGTWDEAYTCNPRVIEGSFANPLGDGQTYTYEMFYVGTASSIGVDNSIGAAFSKDGVTWTKYPNPIIPSTEATSYGVGQPAAYNQDGKSSIVLFYEDYAGGVRHVKATSLDGIHFTAQGALTLAGLDPSNPNPAWGDMAFDPKTGYWYASFQFPVRAVATTDQVVERGPYGYQLYRIQGASLLSGATPWELLKTFDTNLTGYESNFLPSFTHDGYGNVNVGAYPTLELFPSISDPAPPWNGSANDAGTSGDTANWVIGSASWSPDEEQVALTRYSNLVTYQVTTGWVDPGASYKVDTTLGHLYLSPQNGATRPFYGCREWDN